MNFSIYHKVNKQNSFLEHNTMIDIQNRKVKASHCPLLELNHKITSEGYLYLGIKWQKKLSIESLLSCQSQNAFIKRPCRRKKSSFQASCSARLDKRKYILILCQMSPLGMKKTSKISGFELYRFKSCSLPA